MQYLSGKLQNNSTLILPRYEHVFHSDSVNHAMRMPSPLLVPSAAQRLATYTGVWIFLTPVWNYAMWRPLSFVWERGKRWLWVEAARSVGLGTLHDTHVHKSPANRISRLSCLKLHQICHVDITSRALQFSVWRQFWYSAVICRHLNIFPYRFSHVVAIYSSISFY